MQTQHLLHIKSTLRMIDERLAEHEREFRKVGKQKILKMIVNIRKDIDGILKEFNIEEEKRDIYRDLSGSCIFFEVDLIELEPDRFQKAYGKFDFPDEEVKVSDFVKRLEDKIRHLEKMVGESD